MNFDQVQDQDQYYALDQSRPMVLGPPRHYRQQRAECLRITRQQRILTKTKTNTMLFLTLSTKQPSHQRPYIVHI